MKRIVIDFLAGVFVIAAVILLFVVSLNMSTRDAYSSRNSYVVLADFTDVSGLRVRAPVRMAGVKIGDVDQITLNHKTSMARIIMRINNRYLEVIPDDSTVSVLTEGILGAKYVSIDPGISLIAVGPGGQLVKTNPAMVLEKLINSIISKVL